MFGEYFFCLFILFFNIFTTTTKQRLRELTSYLELAALYLQSRYLEEFGSPFGQNTSSSNDGEAF